ncbi:MAG TPA: IS200/IS605 family transposase [Candidatus Binatia bacterium]
MRSRFTQLYLHSVWATWDRMPLLVPAIEQTVYAAVLAKCRQLDCEPLAIGGMADHVHLLVRFPTTLTVADLVKEVKGATSHLVTHEMPGELFKWQGSYGAFTVSKELVPQLRAYIEGQKQHHGSGGIVEEWERTAATVNGRLK